MVKAKKLRLSLVAMAEQVLAQSSRPLHSIEIVEIAVQRGLLQCTAKTPDHSLQAAIWRNRQRLGDESPFVMIGSGRMGRKYWLRSKIKKTAGG